MENKIQPTKEQALILEKKQRKDLALYSPSNCAKFSHKIRTVKDVFNLPSKSLGDFKRAYGKDWVIGYISMWIIELNDDSNVKTKMTDAQMEFTAIRIYETYSLKVTDLTLFFRNIKEGVYGQFYENLSREKIMEWLAEYYKLRCEYGEMMAQCNHENFSLTKDAIDPDVAKKMFDGVGETKVDFEGLEGSGVGSRFKNVVKADLAKEIKSKTTSELREYLVNNDATQKTFDPMIFEMVEKVIDLRNKTK